MTADLRALVDRCLLLGMDGLRPSPFLRDWLAEGLGGVILFRHNIQSPEQLRALTAELHAAGSDVIVAADEEGGDVTRLHHLDGSPNPGNLALGHLDDVAVTREVAAGIGRELAAAGIDLDLAPVADVNTNPDNPIIGTRSFGADPELVARHVVAYVEGLRDAGVPGCAKHFPGHGDTDQDSHLTLPTITGDLEPHLVPFRAAVAAGIPAILSAHIVFPALDSRPATLSKRILTGLLREEMGFEGVIVTDSLTMDAIADGVGVAEGAVQALAAGADLLCINSDDETHRAVREHIVRAVTRGALPEERLVEAAARVGGLARSTARTGQSWSDAALGAKLLYVDVDQDLPLRTAPYVVEVSPPRRGIELTAGSLLATMQRHDPTIDGVRLYEGNAPADPPDDRPLVVVVRDAHRDPAQRSVIASTLARRPDAVVVGIGTPYDASLARGRYIGTHGGARPNLAAAAELLLG
ncbi:MAG TPA: beta-N-acetylhexosaminidase [Actinopolymorphaceae bacterium]